MLPFIDHLLHRQHLDQKTVFMTTSAANSQRNFLCYFSRCTQSSRALQDNKVKTTGPEDLHWNTTSETETWCLQMTHASGYKLLIALSNDWYHCLEMYFGHTVRLSEMQIVWMCSGGINHVFNCYCAHTWTQLWAFYWLTHVSKH